MRNGFASVALLCTVGTPASLGGHRRIVTSAAMRAQARSPFEPFRRDLPRIPEMLPVRRTSTRDIYEVTIQQGMADILPGFQTPIYGYEGVYPGPTIRARTGREVVIRQHNALTFESNVHLHGGYVPAGHDGYPMDVIAPGSSFEYHYPNQQDAASLWYHDHAHGRTSHTLYYGLLAMYVLEDDLERKLDLPTGEYDVPIVIADHAFNKDGSFRYVENIDLGFRGDTILVNGAVSPRMRVERRKYRLRFLNASNARSYSLRLGRGRRMTQIAADGGLLERPVARTRVPLHPAERIDLVIDFSQYAPGHRARPPQRGRPGRHGRRDALRRRARRREGGLRVPRRLRSREPLPPSSATGAGTSDSDRGCGRSTARASTARIDGRRGTARPSAGPSSIARTGCTRCTSTGSCSACSPQQRPSTPGTARVEGHVGVLPNETVTCSAWFAPYSGRYVFHCHSLEHADKAMMLQLRWRREHARP